MTSPLISAMEMVNKIIIIIINTTVPEFLFKLEGMTLEELLLAWF